MLPSSKLRNRLTLWSLILFLLFLGAGGFFCYYAQQQALRKMLDEQLLSNARNFACHYREVAPDSFTQTNFCQDFSHLALKLDGQLAVALYSLEGKILCQNRHPLGRLLGLSPASESHSATGNSFFETFVNEEDQRIRRLTSPIIENTEVRYHLQLAQSMEKVDADLSRYALILIASGLLAAISLSAGQWLLLGYLFKPLTNLTCFLESTNEDNLERKFTVPTFAGKELHQLADSYNNLILRLSKSLQRARQFSTDVTHELRTPLTILRGETELALRGNKSAIELQQILNSNLEEISRMGHLVEDLLLLSKSELGEVPLKMEAINLNDLLEELHFQGNIIAEPKQIKVELQGPEQQVSLLADGHRIRQVFLNLLTNGIKYTPEGGKITIDWSLQNDAVRIIFKDTGIGIDSEHQQHIFDRFYRIDKTRNRNDGGSGLGLAIVKWLVEAHGGSVMVCSVPGQGSSFAVVLPLTR